jgi:hypothetical protein
LGDKVVGQPTDGKIVAQDAAFNGLTGGAFKYLPGVPGRLPNLFTRSFFTGSHTQNAVAQQVANVGIQLTYMSTTAFVPNASQLSSLSATLKTISSILSRYSSQTAPPVKQKTKVCALSTQFNKQTASARGSCSHSFSYFGGTICHVACFLCAIHT